MSKTKKVLSLVMAVALLFNVLAVISSAACATGKVVGIVAESDDALVAGGTVTVDFSFELPAGTDYTAYKLGLFQLLVSYNADVLTPVSRTWGSSFTGFMDDGAIFNTTSSTVHAWVTPNMSAEDAALYTGSAAVQAKIVTGNDLGYSGTTGYPLGAVKDVAFSITFKVADDYNGTDAANVGILASSFNNATRCYLRDITTKSNGKLAKDGSEIDFTEASVTLTAPVAASKVYEVAKQVRANGDNIDLGVKAGFDTKDIAIAFDNATGTSTNVKTVGAKLKVNGEDAGTGTSRFVYKITDTEYQYRVIIENVAKDSTDVYTVELFVEMMDGTIITGDTVEIKAADVVGKLPA